MRDELISFKTAKLAKEKGFNEISERYYHNTSSGDLESVFGYDFWNKNKNAFSAPTQSILQRWLRETFKLWVWVEPDHFNKKGLCTYYIESEDKSIVINEFSEPRYKTWIMANKNHYQALETGLQKALSLIK